MARMSRTRNRTVTLGSGTVLTYFFGDFLVSSSPVIRTFISTCNDSHGTPVIDSVFSSIQYTGVCPYIDGVVVPSLRTLQSRTVYQTYSLGPPSSWTGMTMLPAPSGWMLDLVAGTNPSRPVQNIPIWIQNLAELPKMVKHLGDILNKPKNRFRNPRGLAGEYLGLEFGWLPLVDDLAKLLDFQRYVIKRNIELNQLYLGKGLSRRLQFVSESSHVDESNSTATYANAVVTLHSSVYTHKKTWGTIHWKPTSPPSFHPSDAENNQMARRLVDGLSAEGFAKGLWDVFPWTWLLGWFANLGKYTLANSWTVPADHSDGCFMSEATGTWVASGYSVTAADSKNLTVGGSAKLTIKTRTVGSYATIGASMPYLDMWRLSILGALSVQRFFR